MLSLVEAGERIASARKAQKLTQEQLALKAGVSRSTLDALENGRATELGFSKVANILSALGLELTLKEASQRRPTLEDLLAEDTQ